MTDAKKAVDGMKTRLMETKAVLEEKALLFDLQTAELQRKNEELVERQKEIDELKQILEIMERDRKEKDQQLQEITNSCKEGKEGIENGGNNNHDKEIEDLKEELKRTQEEKKKKAREAFFHQSETLRLKKTIKSQESAMKQVRIL